MNKDNLEKKAKTKVEDESLASKVGKWLDYLLIKNLDKTCYTAGAVIVSGLGLYALTLVTNDYNKHIRDTRVGNIINLRVGDCHNPKRTKHEGICYSGMPSNQKFLIVRRNSSVGGFTSTIPMNFPLDHKKIDYDDHEYSILGITPKNISLRYEGVKEK